MRPTRIDTIARNKNHADDGADAVELYMREVRRLQRLSRDEETVVVSEMVACREAIADLLRAFLLKACDTLAVETGARGRVCSGRPVETYLEELPKLRAADADTSHGKPTALRAAIARLADKARLRGLEAKIATVAAIARRELCGLEQGETSRKVGGGARRALAEIAASFGVSAWEIDRVAAAIEENRQRIQQAKSRLVESNLRLVVYFARRAKWRSAELADLVQEGNFALMRAVEQFDPKHGVPFGTFASIGVCRAIQQFGATAARLVHVPEEVRARRRRVKKAADYLSEQEGVAPSWDAVAEYLEMSKGKVADAFEDTEAALSLDSCIDGAVPIIDSLADERVVDAADALAAFEQERSVRSQIVKLDDRRRGIIEARYDSGCEGSSLAQIGRDLGVSRERVRQMEGRALRELRTNGGRCEKRRPKGRSRTRRRPAF